MLEEVEFVLGESLPICPATRLLVSTIMRTLASIELAILMVASRSMRVCPGSFSAQIEKLSVDTRARLMSPPSEVGEFWEKIDAVVHHMEHECNFDPALYAIHDTRVGGSTYAQFVKLSQTIHLTKRVSYYDSVAIHHLANIHY